MRACRRHGAWKPITTRFRVSPVFDARLEDTICFFATTSGRGDDGAYPSLSPFDEQYVAVVYASSEYYPQAWP